MNVAGTGTVQGRRGLFLCLLTTIAGASGCAGKSPAPAAASGQQQVDQQPAVPPLPGNFAGEAKPAPATAIPPIAGEPSRPSVPPAGTPAQNSWLQRHSASLHGHLNALLKAYHVEQAAAARQKAAAQLQARRDAHQRQQAQAATMRAAQARRALPPQSVPAPRPVPPPPQALPEALPQVFAPEGTVPEPVSAEAAVAATARVTSPPLGVVRDVRPFRGRPYATLSIGYDAGIRRGMRLGLADPRTGAPAGVVVIDESGPAEAGGLVEGPDPLPLHPGLTVHAIADLAP